MDVNIVLLARETKNYSMSVINSSRLLVLTITTTVVIVAVLAATINRGLPISKDDTESTGLVWEPPDTSQIPHTDEGLLIRYGRDLIVNTSWYLGPKGKVAKITNGMNCQNCHLDAGTRTWGNNYGGVFSTYPKYRERSGTIENIYKRVNDCIDRSLNGHIIDTSSREMQAMAAYINWVGQKIPKNVKPTGAGIRDLSFIDRPADPGKGQNVFVQKCQRCHGANGSGTLLFDSSGYLYPPLWGDNSYNTGAGLYRIGRFAGFVRDNMPFDAPHNSEPLTDEQAWDVAAFVNSQPRPQKDYGKDYPNIAGKPVDHPFGPFIDGFSEEQHKYGPFKAISLARKK
jgi:thiosulfate dehydrogenase